MGKRSLMSLNLVILLAFVLAMFPLLAGCAKEAAPPPPAPTPTPAPQPPAPTPPPAKPQYDIKIKWLGHAAFMITSGTGTRIITDPYAPSSRLTYGKIEESTDVVTVSHDHSDHNNVAAVGDNPDVVRGTTEVKGVKFKGISAYHDNVEGKQRGSNTIICFELSGVKVCHLGDLGHLLSDKQAADIGKVDILLIPVGGNYTIDAKVASQICDQLKPSVVIPMHYKTDKCDLPITGVDEFLLGKKDVSRLVSSEVEFKSGQLPVSTQIIVLKPAR